MNHQGRYWHTLEDGRIQCDLCPRDCKIKPGQRGLCFVRANENGQMVLTTYGRSSGFCIDPIEKKPLNHFYPGTPVFFFFWHGRVQFDVQILPELGYFQIPGI